MQGLVLGICASQVFIPPSPCGYVAGGTPSGGGTVSTVDKFRFDNDVRTTLLVGLSSARSGVSGFASTSAGYVAGGVTTVRVTTVDRFAFADDSRATLSAGLSAARSSTCAFASSSAGYVAGGSTGVIVDTVDKFAFADDSRTTLATGLFEARFGAAGFASANAGYAAGGFLNTGGTSTAYVGAEVASKFSFADDSRTTMVYTLVGRAQSGSFSSSTAGYVAGGATSIRWTTVDKVLFADDSRSALSPGLSTATRRLTGYASDVAGYAAGGLTTALVDTVEKFAFVDDSRTTLATGLSAARADLAGFGAPP